MSLTAKYAEALFPDPVRVLGLRLQPYCIGHALLMHRLGNPLVCVGALEWGMGDVLQALYIFTRPWQETVEGLQDCMKGSRCQCMPCQLKTWGRKFKLAENAPALESAYTQLRKHIEQAWEGPDLWEKQEHVKRAGAPVLASLKVTMMHALHRSEGEALSTPVRVALFDSCAWAETQGRVEWIAEDELEAIEQAAQRN